MLLVALRQLTGDYGTVRPGEHFETDHGTGVALVERGLARHADGEVKASALEPEPPALTALKTAVEKAQKELNATAAKRTRKRR